MSFRNTASFGKRQEFIAVAELLRRHFDVYMTLVDDQQIDCVIRQEKEGKVRYLDIQIKARSNECEPKNAGRFAAMEIRAARENFYFIFFSEQANTYWVMSSLKLIEEANQNKEGVNKGKYSINFCNLAARGVSPRPRFRLYENAFHLLEWKPGNGVEPILTSIGINPPKAPPLRHHRLPCWDAIKKLEGQTVETLALHRKFRILEVTENIILIEPESTKNKRPINFENELAPAYKALKTRRRLTLKDVREWSEFSTAFVCAILAQLPRVRYTLKPITLFID